MSDNKASFKIQKVKCKPNDKHIFIAYTYRSEGHTDIRTSLSDEKAAPEFYGAFEALREHAGKILGFTEEQTKVLTPHTVSYSYDKQDAMSAVISCLYETPSKKVININLPLIKCPGEQKEEESPAFFTEEAQKAVWEVEVQTRHYLNGERAQLSLFGEAEGAVAANDGDEQPIAEPPAVEPLDSEENDEDLDEALDDDEAAA